MAESDSSDDSDDDIEKDEPGDSEVLIESAKLFIDQAKEAEKPIEPATPAYSNDNTEVTVQGDEDDLFAEPKGANMEKPMYDDFEDYLSQGNEPDTSPV